MVTGEPMGPEDKSSKQRCISGVWDWQTLLGKSKVKLMYSPQSILTFKFWSTGLKRSEGDAIPKAARVWLDGIGLKSLFVWVVWKVLWTDCRTMSLIAECCTKLGKSIGMEEFFLCIWLQHVVHRRQQGTLREGAVLWNTELRAVCGVNSTICGEWLLHG